MSARIDDATSKIDTGVNLGSCADGYRRCGRHDQAQPARDSDREALALLREASAPARCTILADKAKKVGRPRNGVFMTMYAFNQVTLARQALD